MIEVKGALDFLISEFNIREFIGTPSSNLKLLQEEALRRGIYTSYINESDMVAYAVGRQLADPTIRIGILIDSISFANIMNSLMTLSELYTVPLTILVGNEEPSQAHPQYNIVGEITKELVLTSMMETGGATVELNHSDENTTLIPIPIEYREDSIVYLVGKDVFYNSDENDNKKKLSESSRIKLDDVASHINDLRLRGRKFILVVGTGSNISTMFKYDDPLNFYNYGELGTSWALANGLVANREGLPVICIEGEGSALHNLINTRVYTAPSRCLRIVTTNTEYKSTSDDLINLSDYSIFTEEDLDAVFDLIDKWLLSNKPWMSSEPIIIDTYNPSDYIYPAEHLTIGEQKNRFLSAINSGLFNINKD